MLKSNKIYVMLCYVMLYNVLPKQQSYGITHLFGTFLFNVGIRGLVVLGKRQQNT